MEALDAPLGLSPEVRDDLPEACLANLSLALSGYGRRWTRDILVHIVTQILALCEGPPETTLQRHAERRARLELLGLSPSQARATLRGLPLPDAAAPTDHISLPAVYHPIRLRRALTHDSQAAGAPTRTWTDLPGYVASLRQTMQLDADLPMLPWDREIAHTNLLDTLAMFASTVATQTGQIVDAEMWLCQHPGPTIHRRQIPDAHGLPGYIHFGRDALPSPYPGMGVEGCYVAVLPAVDRSRELVLIPVVSPPRAQGSPIDPRPETSIVRRCLDQGRAVVARYDETLTRLPEPDVASVFGDSDRVSAWDTLMPAILAAALAAIEAHADGDVRPGLPAPGTDHAAVTVLGHARTSAFYPDDGGGFPLAPTYWPSRHLSSWLAAYRLFHEADRFPGPLVGEPVAHGWIDRAVRLIQQVIPNRADLPDLAETPMTRNILVMFLVDMPLESSTMMPTWQALRWLVRLAPVQGEIRIHRILAQSADDDSLDPIAHVLQREMPKARAIRVAWADLVQCAIDARTYPAAADNVAALFARAYHGDPRLAEGLLAYRGDSSSNPDLAILGAHAPFLRSIAARIPSTLILLRADDQTRH